MTRACAGADQQSARLRWENRDGSEQRQRRSGSEWQQTQTYSRTNAHKHTRTHARAHTCAHAGNPTHQPTHPPAHPPPRGVATPHWGAGPPSAPATPPSRNAELEWAQLGRASRLTNTRLHAKHLRPVTPRRYRGSPASVRLSSVAFPRDCFFVLGRFFKAPGPVGGPRRPKAADNRRS